jgi:hypothetical protein
MKRIAGTMGIVPSVLLILFWASVSYPQNTQKDTKEYVSSSPAFTLSYPADWVGKPLVGPVMRTPHLETEEATWVLSGTWP